MERGEKGLCVFFVFLASSGKTKIVLGHSIARATSYCLLTDTF